MKFVRFGVIVLAVAMAFAGCSSKGGAKGGADGLEGAAAGGEGGGGPEIGKYGDGGAYGGAGGPKEVRVGGQGMGDAALDDPSSPLSKRVIYFLYDSSEVQPDYVQVVNSHAGYLAANPGKTVVLEGHADERGSPEYNIALGEQRAKAVSKLLTLQGVSESQIQIVSFGEEKPAVSGHDESSWQQNRRVELSYPGH